MSSARGEASVTAPPRSAARPGAAPPPCPLPDVSGSHTHAVQLRAFAWAPDGGPAPHPAGGGARLRPAGFSLAADLSAYGTAGPPATARCA